MKANLPFTTSIHPTTRRTGTPNKIDCETYHLIGVHGARL